MDLRRLAFLVRVIDAGSITRAAESLRIAQPALSQHLLLLERHYGTPLLLRSKRGVTPTPAGRIVYRHARMLERQLDEARAEVRAVSGAPAGRVTIGIAPHSPARALIQPLLHAVREQYPDILIHVNENFEGVLAADLLLERMDMAFTYEIVPRPGLRYEALLSEPLLLVGHASVLGNTPTDWQPERLRDIPVLLPGASHALRQLADAVFSAAQVRPRLVAEIESFETLAGAARMGLGAIVIPRSVAEHLARRDKLLVRPFGEPDIHITLTLCVTAQDKPSVAARVVHGLALKLGQEIAAQLTPAQPPHKTDQAAVGRRAKRRPPVAHAPASE
jgi:LysR family transcriptional regulator, nitrogen assimilation regulatory protein